MCETSSWWTPPSVKSSLFSGFLVWGRFGKNLPCRDAAPLTFVCVRFFKWQTHLGTSCDGVPLGKSGSKAECALPPLSFRLGKYTTDGKTQIEVIHIFEFSSILPFETYLLLFLCSAVKLLSSSSTFLLRLSFNTLRTLSLEQGSAGLLGRPAQLRWSTLDAHTQMETKSFWWPKLQRWNLMTHTKKKWSIEGCRMKWKRLYANNLRQYLSEQKDLGLLWWSGLAIFTVTGPRTPGELRGVRTLFFLKPSHLTRGRTPTGETPGCCNG